MRTTILLALMILVLPACNRADTLVGSWQGHDGQITEFTADGRMITSGVESAYSLRPEAAQLAVSSGDSAVVYTYELGDDQLTLTMIEMSGRTIPAGDGLRLEFTRLKR